MRINLLLVPLIILMGLVFSNKNTNRDRLIYIILSSSIFIIIASFRSAEWFTSKYLIDTLVYKGYFEEAISMRWDQIVSALNLRYILNSGDFDIGYIVLCKIIGIFTSDFYVYSFIANLLFFIPFGVILYRYTTGVWQITFAYIFYITLIQTYLLGGGRQMFALGFDMMALLAMIDNKKIRSFFLWFLGISLHFSSLLFSLPLIILAIGVKPRVLKIFHLACFMIFPIVLLFPSEFIVFMGNTLGMEKYSNYGDTMQGGATTYIVLIELLSLFCLIAIKKNDLENSKTISTFYVMAPFFTLFAPLIQGNGAMDRITLYFYLYNVLLIPYGIDCYFKNKDRKIAYFITIGALAFLGLINGGPEYYFFWQK